MDVGVAFFVRKLPDFSGHPVGNFFVAGKNPDIGRRAMRRFEGFQKEPPLMPRGIGRFGRRCPVSDQRRRT
jgi:hypothetical protein